MTQKEKAEAYDKALEVLHKYDGANIMFSQSLKEEMFPELKESEDEWVEKIKKDIVSYLKHRPIKSIAESGAIERCLSWFEKQGEQKLPIEKLPSEMKSIGESLGFTTQEECDKYGQMVTDLIMSDDDKDEQKSSDKVEPKFHEGDWTVSNLDKKVRQISEVHFDEYNSYYVVDGKSVNLEEYDRLHHLWTIQDAKDGDVLACNKEILLFKSYSVQGRISLYCWYNGQTNNFHDKEVNDTSVTTRNKIWPATQEQRDLLFQKMKEAGYEWDAEKKELRKIDWNPQPGDTFRKKGTISPTYHLCAKREDGITFGFVDNREVGISGGEITIFALRNDYELVERLKPMKKIIEEEFNDAWSEEDEKAMWLLKDIVNHSNKINEKIYTMALKEKLYDWLKFLKDRIQPQSNQK